MPHHRKYLVLAIIALLVATTLGAQTRTCIRTTHTYSRTYYYSNGDTKTYTWIEIEENCTVNQE